MINSFNLAWLSLTYNCNNRCVWCYSASNDCESVRNKILDSEMEDGIINLLTSLGIQRVTLIGGEPTLYSNLEKLVKN